MFWLHIVDLQYWQIDLSARQCCTSDKVKEFMQPALTTSFSINRKV